MLLHHFLGNYRYLVEVTHTLNVAWVNACRLEQLMVKADFFIGITNDASNSLVLELLNFSPTPVESSPTLKKELD